MEEPKPNTNAEVAAPAQKLPEAKQPDAQAAVRAQTPEVKKMPEPKVSVVHSRKRSLLIILLPILGLLITAAFVLIRKQNMPAPIIETDPHVTHTFEDYPDFTGIPITDDTISFVKADDKFCLLYKNIVYIPQDTGSLIPRTKEVDDEMLSFPWLGLLNSTDEEIYSFQASPSNKSFVFITKGMTKDGDEYRIYRFINNSISEIKVFTPNDGLVYVPKIYKFSSGGNFLNLNMFRCADCLSEYPETLLYYIPTGDTRNIGRVSEFNWTDDDNVYQYKEYKEDVDAAEIPLKTNEFFENSVELLNP